jgi:uncharacterized protein (DUF2336 family)
MFVHRFLQWAQSVPAADRAEGVRTLARVYLDADLQASERRDAELALTAVLDDPSPIVRRALAETVASEAGAPHRLIAALASDQSDIAAIVLSRSPLLSDAELIDAAAIGNGFAQSAIAMRAQLSAPVSAALAEVGEREALIVLATNFAADLPEFSMRRMLQRFGDDGEIREALRARPELPATLCNDIVIATAAVLTDFVTRCNWIGRERAERVAREAREHATVTIAARSSGEGTLKLVAHLRQSRTLTAGLILRALLCGHTGLFEAALAELSGMTLNRVVGLVREPFGAGFAALYRKAKLPAALLPAFRAALAGAEEIGALLDPADGVQLSLQMIERVLSACSAINGGELDKLMALLRRFEAEAARDEVRRMARACTAATSAAIMLAHKTVPGPFLPVSPPHADDRPPAHVDPRAAEIEAMATLAILSALEPWAATPVFVDARAEAIVSASSPNSPTLADASSAAAGLCPDALAHSLDEGALYEATGAEADYETAADGDLISAAAAGVTNAFDGDFGDRSVFWSVQTDDLESAGAIVADRGATLAVATTFADATEENVGDWWLSWGDQTKETADPEDACAITPEPVAGATVAFVADAFAQQTGEWRPGLDAKAENLVGAETGIDDEWTRFRSELLAIPPPETIAAAA